MKQFKKQIQMYGNLWGFSPHISIGSWNDVSEGTEAKLKVFYLKVFWWNAGTFKFLNNIQLLIESTTIRFSWENIIQWNLCIMILPTIIISLSLMFCGFLNVIP